MRGKFISIEGIEGAGKSTAINSVANFLQQANIHFISTREPGGTIVAEAIRHILLNKIPHEPITNNTELLLMFAARSQHLSTIVLPALTQGHWVVSDRFIDASYAYQGGGRGIDKLEIELLDKWIVGENYPDLTLLLDLPPSLGMIRTEARGGVKDRIESEQTEFFDRVRAAYLHRATADSTRIKVIDASRPLQDVNQQIITLLKQFITRAAV